MVKSKAAKTVINDPSSSHVSRLGASHKEWSSFMSSNVADMYNKTVAKETTRNSDDEDEEMDMRKILKEIERLGSSCSTWKERKKLENKNVVALGGKPIKSHRMPLSVAKPMMKNIKRREEKKMEEDKLLGIFSKRKNNHNKAENRRPEDRILKSTEGYFNKGVLNVKHLLDRRPEKSDDRGMSKTNGKRKKGKGKGRGKGKSRRKGKR
ncbi:hypothetical protein KSP39_PZI011709 [Platanthera zijinensis]|uniref:Uncharacterized protein n=1 Tax=Platanthera zijinensis TaxID=2320716 RepID=A0AAP0G5J0_9ASPA